MPSPKKNNNQQVEEVADAFEEEVKAKCREFADEDDHEGFYAYLLDNVKKRESSDKDVADTANRTVDAICEFLADITNTKEQTEDLDFFYSLLIDSDLNKKKTALLVGKKFEDVKEQYENGEIPFVESLADDPKMVNKLAKSTTANGRDGIAQELGYQKSAGQILQLSNRYKKKQKLVDGAAKEAGKVIKAIDTLSDEKKTEYLNSFYLEPPKFVEDIFSPEGDDNFSPKGVGEDRGHKLELAEGEKDEWENDYFDVIPENIKKINRLDPESLSEYKKEVENKIEIMDAYEKSVRSWGDTARNLLNFFDLLPDEAKQSESGKALFASLKNSAKVGYEDYDYMRKNRVATGTLISPVGLEWTFNDTSEKLKAFAEANPDCKDFAENASERIAVSKNGIDSEKKAAEDLIKEAAHSDSLETKNLKKLLKRIEKQQEVSAYKTPEAKEDLGKNYEAVNDIVNTKDRLLVFKNDVESTIDRFRCSIRRFTADKGNRGNLSDTFHGRYNALINGINEVNEMDKDKMTPKQIVDKLIELRNVAKKYVDTHDGAKNFTTGWSAEGRARIKLAKNIYETIDSQLELLQKDCKEFKKFSDDNLEQIENKLDAMKKRQRIIISKKREKYADIFENADEMDEPVKRPKNKKFDFEELIGKAQDNIKSSDDKEVWRIDCANIVTAHFVHLQQIDCKMLNITPSAFRKFRDKIMEKGNFKKAFDKTDKNKLFEAVTEGKGERFVKDVDEQLLAPEFKPVNKKKALSV